MLGYGKENKGSWLQVYASFACSLLGTDHFFLVGGWDEKFSSANIFFEILTIFCYTYRVCKHFILSFQALQTFFFNIFHPPPPSKKIMVRS